MNVTTLPIRVAAPADAEKIAALINAAFYPCERFFIEGPRTNKAEVQQLMSKGAFLLAETGDKLGGCVYVELRGERSYLGLLSVDPALQRGGLGSFLMDAAENYCREPGSSFMDIYIVNLRTELLPFYEGRGYVATGTTPFVEGVETKLPCHFINMSKPL